MAARVYLVEDDESIRELVLYALASSGYEARGFERADAFWEACDALAPSLVLLDIMLPGDDGLAILRRMKESVRTADIPVIMLTAREEETDKVLGLELGADDYITKPFSMRELLARVKANIRRSEMVAAGPDSASNWGGSPSTPS